VSLHAVPHPVGATRASLAAPVARQNWQRDDDRRCIGVSGPERPPRSCRSEMVQEACEAELPLQETIDRIAARAQEGLGARTRAILRSVGLD